MKHSDALGLYILVGQTPVRELDTLKWAHWFETHDPHVQLTQVGPHKVSTVFLGLDHNHACQGPPLLFETMVFPAQDMCQRCSTWRQAEQQHIRIVRKLEKGLPKP